MEKGTLKLQEHHPAAEHALAWIKGWILMHLDRAYKLKEAGFSDNRMGEVCGETLRRIMDGETVSDRYVLGLAWFIKNMK